MSVKFLPPREPLVDPNTGLITRTWYLLFQSLFTIGGDSDLDALEILPTCATDSLAILLAALSDQVQIAPVSVAPILADDVTPTASPMFIAVDDVLPLIGALRDEVALLRREINDLRQGTIA